MFNAWCLSFVGRIKVDTRGKIRKGFAFSPRRTGPIVLLISKKGEISTLDIYTRIFRICISYFIHFPLSFFLSLSTHIYIYIYLLPLPSVADPIRASSFKSVVLAARYQLWFLRGFSSGKNWNKFLLSSFFQERRKKRRSSFRSNSRGTKGRGGKKKFHEGKDFGNIPWGKERFEIGMEYLERRITFGGGSQ